MSNPTATARPTCAYCGGRHAVCHLRPRPAAFPTGYTEPAQPYSPWI